MSRLGAARISRIVIWTGAAVTWGAAIIAGRLEPARVAAQAVPPVPEPVVSTPSTVAEAMPTPPAGGLLILRYDAVEAPPPEVRTVVVQGSAPAASAAPSAPAANPAPATTSSGS